jgi:uncharacterized membrane protein
VKKLAKIFGWIIFGPIVWLIFSILAAIIIAIALFQMATNKLPTKDKNYGLTPPDKAVIDLN